MTAVVVAIKTYDDSYFQQDYYAKVAGIEKKELLELETRFVKLLGHNSMIAPHTFESYV